MPSSSLIVVVSEMRAVTTRSVALAGIAALAVYGSVAIGGARTDLLHGLDASFSEYLGTAELWVTTGGNDLTTNAFDAERRSRVDRSAPGWLRARLSGRLPRRGRTPAVDHRGPAGDSSMIPASQLLKGDPARARGCCAKAAGPPSPAFANEHHLHVGGSFVLPTPAGHVRFRVAAITTNLGWSPGAVILNTARLPPLLADQRSVRARGHPRGRASARRRAGAPSHGRSRDRPGLAVHTLARTQSPVRRERAQGLSALSEIATLLLIAAALAVAAALSAAIWQRRPRLASLKIQGYDTVQLWRALLLESAIVLGVGCAVGALTGIYGHALGQPLAETARLASQLRFRSGSGACC